MQDFSLLKFTPARLTFIYLHIVKAMLTSQSNPINYRHTETSPSLHFFTITRHNTEKKHLVQLWFHCDFKNNWMTKFPHRLFTPWTSIVCWFQRIKPIRHAPKPHGSVFWCSIGTRKRLWEWDVVETSEVCQEMRGNVFTCHKITWPHTFTTPALAQSPQPLKISWTLS